LTAPSRPIRGPTIMLDGQSSWTDSGMRTQRSDAPQSDDRLGASLCENAESRVSSAIIESKYRSRRIFDACVMCCVNQSCVPRPAKSFLHSLGHERTPPDRMFRPCSRTAAQGTFANSSNAPQVHSTTQSRICSNLMGLGVGLIRAKLGRVSRKRQRQLQTEVWCIVVSCVCIGPCALRS